MLILYTFVNIFVKAARSTLEQDFDHIAFVQFNNSMCKKKLVTLYI